MSRPFLYTVTVADPRLDFEGYLVVDTLQHGLSAGGVRMRAGLTPTEVGRLARAMTVKFAAADIAVGGAKAGINADPNRADKPAVMRRFGELLRPFMAQCYLPGEDMGTTKADLKAMYEGAGVNPIVTAKACMAPDGITIPIPEEMDMFAEEGPGLEELLTGHGVAACVAEAADVLGFGLDGARVSMQGFGNVGAGTAPHLVERGARFVAIADAAGTLVCEDGLPIDALLERRDALGGIDRAALPQGVRAEDGPAWLRVESDILIPAAIADVITTDNQAQVNTRLLVEAANIPCTEDAERSLAARGIPVVPDFIANAGAACGFGLLLTGQVDLDPAQIYDEVARRIRRATRAVLERWQRDGTPPRDAARALAERKLGEFAAS